jgi:hypothetical protein
LSTELREVIIRVYYAGLHEGARDERELQERLKC